MALKKKERKKSGAGGREGGSVCVLYSSKPAPQGDVSISFGLSLAALFEVSWGKSKPLSRTVSCIFDQGPALSGGPQSPDRTRLMQIGFFFFFFTPS